MTQLRSKVLLLVGIALALSFGCNGCNRREFLGQGPGPGHHYGQQGQREFQVYIYADPNNPGGCLLDWPVATLWKSEHHTVRWFSDDGSQYTIDFTQGTHAQPKSPFQSDTYTVPGGKSLPSGSLQQAANGYYDFAVRAGDSNGPVCKQPNDPGYYIK